MEKKDNMDTITLRICDLNSVLYILSMGNQNAVNAAWDSIEIMRKNV